MGWKVFGKLKLGAQYYDIHDCELECGKMMMKNVKNHQTSHAKTLVSFQKHYRFIDNDTIDSKTTLTKGIIQRATLKNLSYLHFVRLMVNRHLLTRRYCVPDVSSVPPSISNPIEFNFVLCNLHFNAKSDILLSFFTRYNAIY